MASFKRLHRTLSYAKMGLVSLAAAISPINLAAQELCGADLFEGEPDAADLMERTVEFLDVLESGGVIAFQGREGRMTVEAVRQALQDGVGSLSLLTCVVDAEAIEFDADGKVRVVECNASGLPSFVQPITASIGPPTRPWPVVGADPTAALARTPASLFCTTEVVAFAQYIGSQA